MGQTSFRAFLLLSTTVVMANCSAVEEYIEEEIGDRANELAGDRLILVHGETTLNGASISGTMSTDGGGNVTGTAPGASETASLMVDLNLGDMEELTLSNGSGTVQFLTANGDSIDDGADRLAITASSSDGQRVAWVGNPLALDFDHQTYGVWAEGVGTSSGTISAGSFGTRTAASNMPTSGSATYNGSSAGVRIRTDGVVVASQSQVTITTSDFSSMNIASTNSYASELDGSSTWRAENLDFAGSGTISGNEFSATINGVTTFSSTSSGTASGHFYGDNAEEVGGTFEMTGPIGVFSGAFGADQ